MTIHLKYREAVVDSWSDFDVVANAVKLKRLQFSYQQPARLEFTVHAPEHTDPIPANSEVLMWDDVGTDENGDPFDIDNPQFVGFVGSPKPGAHANEVVYVANDPTYRAAKSVTVMSLPYDSGADNPASGSVPRLVVNVKNTSDDDYAYSFGQNMTVGEIIAGLFDFTTEPLRAIDAAPASGTPYDSGDLAAMTFKPQQKLVFETQTINAAVESVWRHEPRFRKFWHPASRQWRFHRLYAGTAKTLVLNDFGYNLDTTPKDHVLVGMEVTPNCEECFTAVEISGPPSCAIEVFDWETGVTSGTATNSQLHPVGSAVTVESYSDTGGMQTAEFWQTFQIHDPLKRAGAKLLPDYYPMTTGNYASSVRWPILLASYDAGVTWHAHRNVYIDYLNGTVTWTGPVLPYVTMYDENVPIAPVAGSTQTKFVPDKLRLVWAPYDDPLSVRYPSSGFSGTAYSLLGMERVLRLYDESLAIGREYGTPVTSVERLAQFATIAEYLQEVRRDITFTGQATLTGCDYSYARLGCMVNLEDAAGETTGWEDINAIVTDVEYVYGDTPSTNISFSANWLELYGEDPSALRERLRVKSMDQYKYSELFGAPIVRYQYTPYQNFNGSWSNMVTGGLVYDPFVYVDPATGYRELANIR